MIVRRDLAGLVGAGALAATTLSLSSTARAQGGNTFDRVMAAKKIRLGAVAAGQPWFYKDQAAGKWGGQFFDIGSALAADMDVQLELVETTWGNAVLDLQADKIDVMFGLNPTPKRAMVVDFTGTVYDSALVIIARPRLRAEDLGRAERSEGEDLGRRRAPLTIQVGRAPVPEGADRALQVDRRGDRWRCAAPASTPSASSGWAACAP
jgi:hypothetical protein